MGVIVRSEKYKGLIVGDVGLRFVDGELEVEDPKVLARLRRLAHLGVVVPDDTPSGRRSGPRSGTKAGQGATGKGKAPEPASTPQKPADAPEGGVAEPKGNASRDEWAAYAAHLGLEVPDDAGRDAIKDLVAAAAAESLGGGEQPDDAGTEESEDDESDDDADAGETSDESDAGDKGDGETDW
ncbi:hypothetical protein [Cellulosimicrobium sp. SL-1]|uniref:hypothetical protein n=1 Tax=Cellulosimicrobium sp. SL-1 TaxID=2699423 RepID=UPI0013CF715B|nr:hypothetical protein [Cellulosimicrobium sp. SL-1]